jgi:hypothetical protein
MKTLEWKGNMPYLFSHTLISWIYHGGDGILCGTPKIFFGKVTNERTNAWVFFEKIMFDFHKQYEKKVCFATSLVTQFLSCIDHLQLTVFIHCEWYRTSYKSCKSCNSLYIQCNSLQLITTLLQQFLFNYYHPLWL